MAIPKFSLTNVLFCLFCDRTFSPNPKVSFALKKIIYFFPSFHQTTLPSNLYTNMQTLF